MMKDVQNHPDTREIPIDRVGVCDLRYPIIVMDRENRQQSTTARLSMSVNLPREFKGTHMGRFIEILNAHRGEITMRTLPTILQELKDRLDAESAHIEVEFPYFLERCAPVSGARSLMDYECVFTGEINGATSDFVLTVRIPVTSLCPCSKAIREYGAHNQHGYVTVEIRSRPGHGPIPELVWIEELVALAEASASAPLYPLLKREDERHVTMQAYDKDRKPAWIVDGQQRVLAISKSKRRDLPVPVNAFVADDIEIQRDQFLRVNNTRALPRGLITELLPEVSTPLPANLEAKKIPSAICELLNSNEQSPFYQLIRRASLSSEHKKNAMISDASIITIVQESISSPAGCLFPYRNLATGETDFDGIWKILVAYWTAVKATFPDAWGKPPSKSRLMRGVGLRSMGRLMDRVMSSVDPHSPHALAHVKHELQIIAPVCHWTSGRWSELGDLQWNEIQNVPRHIRMLSSFLIRAYVQNRGTMR